MPLRYKAPGCLSRRTALSAVALAALAAAFPAASTPTPGGTPRTVPEPLRIETRARALAPGEVLRVVLESPVALSAVEGRLEDRPLFFSPVPVTAGGQGSVVRWSAWGVIPLDAKAGTTRIEVTARAAEPAGTERRASRTIRIAAKSFPESRLKVGAEYVEPPEEVQKRIAQETARLGEVYGRRTERPPPTGPFQRPVAGPALGVFGAKRFFNGKPRAPHPGLDLRAAEGTEVKASGAGRVALADDLYFSGRTVILDHGGGFFTIYGHLSKIVVAEGAEVEAGHLLGLSGATGRVTGPHLHWGAKVGDLPFDPTGLLDPRVFAP